MSTKTIDNYLQFVTKEQDELSLQKSYLSEATLILTSEELADSYQAFINCLTKYPKYLFKKEKEFMFFMAKIHELLKISTEDAVKFHDPSIVLDLDEYQYKLDIYHTINGVYELNFSYLDTEMAMRIEVDMPKKSLTILTQDVLNLSVPEVVKSYLIHYLSDLIQIFETINFKVKYEITSNINPFLTFKELAYQRIPHLADHDFDQLFISMDGQGDMRYLDQGQGVHVILDEDNEAYITSSIAENVSDIKLVHKQEQIYLFDLLAKHPYIKQLLLGELLFNQD